MKLRTQIIWFFIFILTFSLGSMAFLSYSQMRTMFNEQLKEKLMDIAVYTSQDLEVQTTLANRENNSLLLNEHIETIRTQTGVDFISVIDMEGIRLTHPILANIGKKFVGGDEARVLETGESYASEGEGTLGSSLRVFSPIFSQGRQIGAVSVGSTLADIRQETQRKMAQFIPFIVIALGLGISLAYILASNIKYSILGMEPNEITLMFKEKEAILDNVKEGIITLNEEGRMIQYNKEAARILGLSEESMKNQDLPLFARELFSRTQTLAQNSEHFEADIRPGVTIIYKSSPITNHKDKVIGQVINFRDMTEVKDLAEELTGYRKMAWSLRAQNHEFLNKLHTISGLIQLEEYGKALTFISSTAQNNENITGIITRNLKNVNIAALVLAKFYKAEEMHIHLEIDEATYLENSERFIDDDDLSSVIGDLIENSLEAVAIDGSGEIFLKIREEKDRLTIELRDNGPGIPVEIQDKIYERSFSTKIGQRGYGLYIVKNIVEGAGGEIDLDTSQGTAWSIQIPEPKEAANA
ncbi:MAG: sensor histidine kinase [Clostridiaceae bacterium]